MYRKLYTPDAFVRAARRQASAEQAERTEMLARRAAKRRELQPEYDALDAWHTAQMKERGLSTELEAEMNRRLLELDMRVAAA